MLRRFPGVVVELRTARANHIPHSTLRFPERKRKHPHRWTVRDSILQIALTIYEDGLCSGCGQPVERSWNEDMEGEYITHRRVCQACKAIHLDHDSHGPLGPGERSYVTDDSPDGYEPDPRMMPAD